MGPTGPSPHVPIPRQKMHKHVCDSTVEQLALSSGVVSHLYHLGLETQALPAATLTCLRVAYCLRSPRGTMYYEFRLSFLSKIPKFWIAKCNRLRDWGPVVQILLVSHPTLIGVKLVYAWKRISLVLFLSPPPFSLSLPNLSYLSFPLFPWPSWLNVYGTAHDPACCRQSTPREARLWWKLTRRMTERSQVSEDDVGLPILPRLDPPSLWIWIRSYVR